MTSWFYQPFLAHCLKKIVRNTVKKNLWQFSITKTQDSEDYLLADVRRKTYYALFFPYSSIFLCCKRAQN